MEEQHDAREGDLRLAGWPAVRGRVPGGQEIGLRGVHLARRAVVQGHMEKREAGREGDLPQQGGTGEAGHLAAREEGEVERLT